MKYLLGLILLVNVTCFGQDYKSSIADFRKGYMADFLTDAISPLKKDDLQNLRFYDADSTYRVTATAEIQLNKPSFMMSAFTGGSLWSMYLMPL